MRVAELVGRRRRTVPGRFRGGQEVVVEEAAHRPPSLEGGADSTERAGRPAGAVPHPSRTRRDAPRNGSQQITEWLRTNHAPGFTGATPFASVLDQASGPASVTCRNGPPPLNPAWPEPGTQPHHRGESARPRAAVRPDRRAAFRSPNPTANPVSGHGRSAVHGVAPQTAYPHRRAARPESRDRPDLGGPGDRHPAERERVRRARTAGEAQADDQAGPGEGRRAQPPGGGGHPAVQPGAGGHRQAAPDAPTRCSTRWRTGRSS